MERFIVKQEITVCTHPKRGEKLHKRTSDQVTESLRLNLKRSPRQRLSRARSPVSALAPASLCARRLTRTQARRCVREDYNIC